MSIDTLLNDLVLIRVHFTSIRSIESPPSERKMPMTEEAELIMLS